MACKAIIQDGPRKGKHCIPVTVVDEDGYCKKHQRQKEYNILVTQGKKLCNKFFRGCNSEVSEAEKACATCRGKNKKSLCNHVYEDGRACTYEILNDTKYCGKHQRNVYREYERDTSNKLCNIERGCMNICEEDFQSCKSCIVNDYIVNDRYYSEHFENDNTCIVCEIKYESAIMTDALKRCATCCAEFMSARKDKKVVQQRAYSDMSLEKYYETYFKGAYRRNADCEFYLSLSEFQELVTKPCYYCGSKDSHSFNGIDRVDNKGDYCTDNTVPCCSPCNRMKHSNSIGEFINKCVAIHTYTTTNKSITSRLMDTFGRYKTLSTMYYSDYKKNNGVEGGRNLEFTLSKEEFGEIRTNPCYLCGVENTDDHYNGIDRVDNSKGYILSNCKPCCGHCNFIKASIPVGIVKTYSTKIATNPDLSQYIVNVNTYTEESESDDETVGTSKSSEAYESVKSNERFSSKKLSELFYESMENVLNYCAAHERSNTFTRNVQKLYEAKDDKTQDEIHVSILRYLNNEKKKTHMSKKDTDPDVKQHKKVNDVLTMLEDDELDEFLEWHNLHVGKESTVFRKHLTEFMAQFETLTAQQKIERCREILQQEKSRRNAKKANDKLKEKKETILPTITETPKLSKPFLVVDVTTLMPKKPNVIEHVEDIAIPRQWKTRDIFDFLAISQEHHYKAYCESNNSLVKEWPDQWASFLSIKGKPWEEAEPLIRTFVENLRRIRHLELIANKKNLLDREDRQVWPAETVAALFLAGRIGEFKTMTETYVGDDPKDPKWMKRWDEFVGTLKAQNNDKAALTKEIAKFMASQRAKKFRRSKT